MDFTQEHLLYLILLVISLAYLFLFKFTRTKHNPPLPPGSMGWPIIGETLEIQRLCREGKAEDFIKTRMNKYNRDIFKTSIVLEKTITFCGAHGNKFLFTNERTLVTTWWPEFLKKFYGNAFLLAPYDEAIRIRKVVVAFLQQEVMQQLVERFDKSCKNCFQSDWIGKNKVMALLLIKKYAFSIACEIFASMDDPNWQAKMLEEFHMLFEGSFSLPIYLPGTRHYKARKSAVVIRRELIELIERKRRMITLEGRVEKDLLSHLMDARDENGKVLNDKEIVENVMILLDAGHGTSSSTMMMIMKYLAENPDCYRRVLEEQREIASQKRPGELLNKDDIQKMKYSWNVASEVLRISPPVQGTFRKAKVDFTYAGFSIPKGWMVWWNTVSTHHVAEYFPNPEKFDPLRFERDVITPYTFVPFGGGPRMCPGNNFARIAILVFLHNLVKEFRWELVYPNEIISVDPMPTSKKGLPVYLYPH